MPKFLTFLFALLCVTAAAPLFPMEWALIRHPYSLEKMRLEIDGLWKQGFYPVGISIVAPPSEESGSYVLYLKGGPVSPSRWTIRRYNDLTAVREDIQDKVDSGWTPFDISSLSNDLYVLYLQVTNRVSEWRIDASPNSLEDLKNTIEPPFRGGFSPFGITGWGDNAWVLSLKSEGLKIRRWQITDSDADDDVVKDQMDSAIAAGWIPWSLSMESKALRLLYVKFTD